MLAEVRAALEALREELKAALAGQVHARAWAALGNEPYAEESFRLWEERLERHPSDHVALHHLAIMCHAKAYDLENEGSDDAFVYWRRALELWAELLKNDRFWDEIEQKMKRLFGDRYQRQKLQEFRAGAGRYLLDVHKELVLERAAAGDRTRAKGHLGLILEAPFEEGLKSSLRDELYRTLADPGAVSEALELRDFERAEGMLAAFLDLDPDYPPAWGQILDVYNKWHDHLWAADRDWSRLEQLLEKAGPYAEKLEGAVASADDPVARARLADYYFNAGITADDKPKSFEEAMKKGRKPTPRQCDEALDLYSRAVEAYEKAARYRTGFNLQRNRLRAAYFMRAQIRFVKAGLQSDNKELKRAEEDLQKAERLANEAGDGELLQLIGELLQLIQYLRVQYLLGGIARRLVR